MARPLLLTGHMEPIDDRGYGATLGSGLWVQSSMIGVMEPPWDRGYGSSPWSGLWSHSPIPSQAVSQP